MKFLRIYLILLVAVYCTATLTVDLELIFYSNPTHEDCDGGHCESSSTAMCDNKFDFCVRAAGNDTCLTPVVRTNDLDSDTITFSPSELSELEINNPIQFSSILTSDLLEWFVDVTDDDGSPANDDEVDEIVIPLGAHLQADSEFGPNVTYYGSCGRANIQVRTRITSECPPNRYGPTCTKVCVEVPGRTACNYLGQAVCLDNFDGVPDCNECKAGFYGSSCDRFCEPQDSNSSGHYTCDDSGYIVCHPGFTDNSTNCLTCAGNRMEPDCRVCKDNYYPQGTCDTFCKPRNDVSGHYNCSEQGELVCLAGYTDTSTNCTTCRGNFKEPDCNECDDHFVGVDCTFCELNYYPRNDCSVMCMPENSSDGHYTCDPFTGSRVCLEGYKDPASGCVTAAVTSESSSIVGSVGFYVMIGLGGLFVTTVIVTIILVASFTRQRRLKYYSGARGSDTQPIIMEGFPQPTDEEATVEVDTKE